MSTKVELAAALAKHFHAGQKYGELDYFSHHLCGVVEQVYQNYKNTMPFTLVDAICVAYLHDLYEDTEISTTTEDYTSPIEELFGTEIDWYIDLLTKYTDQDRKDYLDQVKMTPLATFVKICDAEFNRDSCLSDGDEKRAEYYQDTIDYLKGENK